MSCMQSCGSSCSCGSGCCGGGSCGCCGGGTSEGRVGASSKTGVLGLLGLLGALIASMGLLGCAGSGGAGSGGAGSPTASGPEAGAVIHQVTPEHAATTGRYFDQLQPRRPSPVALDRATQDRLWALTEGWIGAERRRRGGG